MEAAMHIAFQPVFEPVKHFAAHIAFGYQPNFVAMWLEAAMSIAFQPVFGPVKHFAAHTAFGYQPIFFRNVAGGRNAFCISARFREFLPIAI